MDAGIRADQRCNIEGTRRAGTVAFNTIFIGATGLNKRDKCPLLGGPAWTLDSMAAIVPVEWH